MSLSELLASRAGTLSDYDGAAVPADFGDVEGEWRAFDEGAALVAMTHRRMIVATGGERVEFLQGQLAHDIKALAAGRGTAAALLTTQGRVVAIVDVYDAGEEIHIGTVAAGLARTTARLEQFLVADDVEFEVLEAVERLAVAGPGAAAALESCGLAPATPPRTGAWSIDRIAEPGVDGWLYSRGDLRVPCVEVAVAGDAAPLWERLEKAGARPAGSAALEIVRIESGRPRDGVDVDEGRLALEARIEWAIHFRKGCYVGQEIVERAVSRGRVHRMLALLATAEPAPVGAVAGDDKDVVTSVAVSPRLGPICLCYLAREAAEPGASVTLKAKGSELEARVLDWPQPQRLAGRAGA